MSGALPDPLSTVPEAPAELCAIIRQATASAPDDRYASAADLAADLEAWLDGNRVSAHRYTAADELSRAFSRFRRTVLVAAVIIQIPILAITIAEGPIVFQLVNYVSKVKHVEDVAIMVCSPTLL